MHDFGDPEIRGGFRERPQKFKMEQNRRYRVRVMTVPLSYLGANCKAAGGSDSGFFALSLAPFDVGIAAIKGDKAALAKAQQLCPLFERGYQIDRRWVVLLHVIATESRGRMTKLDQVLPWAFGKDKYAPLTEIVNTLRTADGRKIPLSRVELNILCTEAGYQKATITAITSRSQMICSYEESLAKCAHELYDPTNPDAGSPLLDDFLEPEPREDLVRSLNRLEGQGALPADRDNFDSPANPPVGSAPAEDDPFGDGAAFPEAPAESDDAGAAPADDGSLVDDLDSLLQ